MPDDVAMIDAVSLSAALHARQISSVEVMRACLDRIGRYNPAVNAIISLRPEEELLAEARLCDDEMAHGQSRGFMHGFPHAVKDLANTKGLATTFGSPIFAQNVPDFDDIIVERLRASGAIIIGKTNTPEFGKGSQSYNPIFGVTGNAYDPSKTAGGSSGGAAVALALGLTPLADGGDMMGSLRNPAGWNNIVSLRPSLGRVPQGPMGERFFSQLSVLGPMARTVGDLARMLDVMAGFDPRAPQSLPTETISFANQLDRDPGACRIGYLGDLDGALAYEPGVEDLCIRALDVFADMGCTVETISIGFDPARIWDSWMHLRHLLESNARAALYQNPKTRDLLKPEMIWEIESGFSLSAAQIGTAMTDRSAWYGHLLQLFSRFDFLILPSAQVFPFDKTIHWPREIAGRSMDTYHRWMQVVTPASLAGMPTATVPAGFSAQGLPMGLQIIGPLQADRRVLQMARAYERATQWVARCPPKLLSSGAT
jgi:amidase